MIDWVSVGSFCPNEACPDYGKVEGATMVP